MRLTAKQSEALSYLEDTTTNEVLFGGGAGGGKSLLGCYWILKSCLKYPDTRWLIGRSQLKTLRQTTLNTFFEVCQMQGLEAEKHYHFNQAQMVINIVNKSEIYLKDLFTYPSDPNFDSLGSLEITGAFIDEVNQISEKAWNIVKSRIRFKLDQFGLIPKILGTCNPSKGYLYAKFYKPSQNGSLPVNLKFVRSLLANNPHISKHYKSNLLQLDNASKERLLFGNWEYEDDPAVLMPYMKIIDCFTNTHVIPQGERFISADIARYGQDKTVICLWHGMVCGKILTLQNKSITEVAEIIKSIKNKASVPLSNIIVDEDGVGGGVMDILGCKGFLNNGKPIGGENFQNLKSQCYFKLAELVNANKVYIIADDPDLKSAIIEEFEQIKRANMDKDGKLAVIGKEHIKEAIGRSPDYADAIMMRQWFALQPVFEQIDLKKIYQDFL